MMSYKSLTSLAHTALRESIRPGDTVIDATLGNGHDALFLARLVQPDGHLFGFDIQAPAVMATQQRLKQAGLDHICTLFTCSHALMRARIPAHLHGQISAITFNLGYLPGSDKAITTTTRSTLEGLDHAVGLLSSYGTLTVIAYPGHPGGAEEAWPCENGPAHSVAAASHSRPMRPLPARDRYC